MSIINILSSSLQSKTATLDKAKNIVNLIIQTFTYIKSDDEFLKLWLTIKELAEKNNVFLEVPCIGLFTIISFLINL